MCRSILRVLLILAFCSLLLMSCGSKTEIEKQLEDDGFVWYKVTTIKWGKFLYGALDGDKNILIPAEYDNVIYENDDVGLFLVTKDGLNGAYTWKGKKLVDARFDEVSVNYEDEIDLLWSRVVIAINDEECLEGVFDENGNTLLPVKYKHIHLSGYHDIENRKSIGFFYYFYVQEEDGTIAFYSTEGEKIFDVGKYEFAEMQKRNGVNYVLIQEENAVGRDCEGIMDMEGNVIIEPNRWMIITYNDDKGFIGYDSECNKYELGIFLNNGNHTTTSSSISADYGSTYYGGYNQSYQGYPSGSVSTGSTSRQATQVWHDCSLCKGSGRVVRESPVALFGTIDTQEQCPECGEWHYRSTGHHHITCPQCHGNKGYYTTEYR